MGVGNVFVTDDRASHVTYTAPFDYERACFLTPSPKPLPSWMSVTFPFTRTVWILLLVSMMLLTLLVPALAAGLLTKDQDHLYSPFSTFLLILALFINQSRPKPTCTPMQVMVGLIMVGGFVVSFYYSSNLTAFMTVRSMEQPLTSISQIAQSQLVVGGYSDFWPRIFQGSANQHVRSLYTKFYRFHDVTQFLKQVMLRKAVLVENTQHLKYLQQTLLGPFTGRASVRLMLEQCINPFPVAAILQKNSPLKPTLDKVIYRLRETGLVEKMFQEVLQEARVLQGARTLQEARVLTTQPDHTNSQVQPLTLYHLQGAFVVLGLGLSIGVMVLLMESMTAWLFL